MNQFLLISFLSKDAKWPFEERNEDKENDPNNFFVVGFLSKDAKRLYQERNDEKRKVP